MSNAPKRFDPPGAKFTGMSQAIRTGDFITVSGQVALKDGKVVGVGDPKAQAQQCFENIGAALVSTLATMGASRSSTRPAPIRATKVRRPGLRCGSRCCNRDRT